MPIYRAHHTPAEKEAQGPSRLRHRENEAVVFCTCKYFQHASHFPPGFFLTIMIHTLATKKLIGFFPAVRNVRMPSDEAADFWNNLLTQFVFRNCQSTKNKNFIMLEPSIKENFQDKALEKQSLLICCYCC